MRSLEEIHIRYSGNYDLACEVQNVHADSTEYRKIFFDELDYLVQLINYVCMLVQAMQLVKISTPIMLACTNGTLKVSILERVLMN